MSLRSFVRRSVGKPGSLLMAVALIVAAAAVGCGGSSSPAASPTAGGQARTETAAQFKWNMGGITTPGAAISKPWEDFAKIVTQRSGGRLSITYSGDQLAKATDVASTLVKGTPIQIAMLNAGYSADVLPLGDILEMPFVWPTDIVAANLLAKNEVHPFLKPYFQSKGLELVATNVSGPSWLWTKKKVTKLEDMAGMMVRVSSPSTSMAVGLVGAKTAQISGAELYSALERGVVEGAVTGFQFGAGSQKLHEIVKNIMKVPVVTPSQFIAVNKKAWDSLPDDLKAIIQDEAWRTGFVSVIDSADRDFTWERATKTAGVTVTTPSEAELERWRQAVQPMYKQMTDKTGADGKKLLDLILAGGK